MQWLNDSPDFYWIVFKTHTCDHCEMLTIGLFGIGFQIQIKQI